MQKTRYEVQIVKNDTTGKYELEVRDEQGKKNEEFSVSSLENLQKAKGAVLSLISDWLGQIEFIVKESAEEPTPSEQELLELARKQISLEYFFLLKENPKEEIVNLTLKEFLAGKKLKEKGVWSHTELKNAVKTIVKKALEQIAV